MEDLILMEKDLICEITEYMDKFRDPKQCDLEYMYTYIFTKDSKPVIGTIMMLKIMKNIIFGI